jgi:hypothetical protein
MINHLAILDPTTEYKKVSEFVSSAAGLISRKCATSDYRLDLLQDLVVAARVKRDEASENLLMRFFGGDDRVSILKDLSLRLDGLYFSEDFRSK